MVCETDVVTSSQRTYTTASAVFIKAPDSREIDRFVSIQEASDILNISKSTFYRMIDIDSPYYNPECPVPVCVSFRRKIVLLSALEKFMANRTSK